MQRSQQTTFGYLLQNRRAARGLRAIDFCLTALLSRPSQKPLRITPKRILLANSAHLGDLVTTTSILPVLRRHYPDAEIGLLRGSWGKNIYQAHPWIAYQHICDHFLLNRTAGQSVAQKCRQHLKSAQNAWREIRALKYDLAIDLYPYLGNQIPLLFATRIPIRVGYTSGGFGAMLTHALPWKEASRSICHYYFDLLQLLGVEETERENLKLSLPPISRPDREILPVNPYIIIHIGTANSIKEWPHSLWQELVEHLDAAAIEVLFTGQGARESTQLTTLLQGRSERLVNYCDQLSWQEFQWVIQHAKALVGVDSLSVHLAAAYGTPCLVLSSGINDPKQWGPFGPYTKIANHPTPCTPCYRKKGCETMPCLRQIPVKEVLDWILHHWESAPSEACRKEVTKLM